MRDERNNAFAFVCVIVMMLSMIFDAIANSNHFCYIKCRFNSEMKSYKASLKSAESEEMVVDSGSDDDDDDDDDDDS